MIDWIDLGLNALWITGLSLIFSAVGIAYDSAVEQRHSLLQVLRRAAYQFTIDFAMVLFCFGVSGLAKTPWERYVWALIGFSFLFSAGYRLERKKRITVLRYFLAIFLACFLVWSTNLGWHAWRLVDLARRVQADPGKITPQEALPLLESAGIDLSAIRQDLSPLFPVFNVMKGLPNLGPTLGQVEPWVAFADELAQTGKSVATGLDPIINKVPDSTKDSNPLFVIQSLQAGQSRFKQAAQSLERARDWRGQIQADLLPTRIRPLYEKLDSRFDLLTAAVQALQAAPRILGASQAQIYLILAQNRDELRATGGFISGIGWVTLQNGQIKKLKLGDSYQLDDFSKPYPTPPEPLKRFMLADLWVARDSNWSPDFPSTARQAQSLVTLTSGMKTQGVIAFNQLAVRALLEITGPVQIEGITQPIRSSNVDNYMREAWAPAPDQSLDPEWWSHRKDFMQQLGSALLAEAMKITDKDRLLQLASTSISLINSGQILVYFNDPQSQKILSTAGWDGAVKPGTGDLLYLVDSNVGFNKVDSVIQRSITYTVDLRDIQNLAGQLSIRYQHNGNGSQTCKQEISYGNGTYADMQNRCYLDYWRIYTSESTRFLSSNTPAVPGEQLLNPAGWSGQVEISAGENQTSVMAGLMMLPPGQSMETKLNLALSSLLLRPAGPNQLSYALHIQKQSGISSLPITLEIFPPQNYAPLNLSVDWKKNASGAWVYSPSIENSMDLKFIFSKITNP
jgi:hypothetical protein